MFDQSFIQQIFIVCLPCASNSLDSWDIMIYSLSLKISLFVGQ